MIWLLIITAAAITALVAALSLFVPLFDFRRFVPRISEAVKNAAGLEVAFRGDIRVSLLTGPRVHFGDVRIESVPNKSGVETARIERVSVRLRLLPLIKGSVQLDGVVVRRPKVGFEINALRAAESWSALPPVDRKRSVATETTRTPGGVIVKNIRVERGLLNFRDSASGRTDFLSVNRQIVHSLLAERPGQIDFVGALKERPLEINTPSVR